MEMSLDTGRNWISNSEVGKEIPPKAICDHQSPTRIQCISHRFGESPKPLPRGWVDRQSGAGIFVQMINRCIADDTIEPLLARSRVILKGHRVQVNIFQFVLVRNSMKGFLASRTASVQGWFEAPDERSALTRRKKGQLPFSATNVKYRSPREVVGAE